MYIYPEFNCLKKIITWTDTNTTAYRYHVPEIERHMQVVKEWMRTIYYGLPYNFIKIWMVIDIRKYVVMIINAFPPKSGISRTHSPRTTVTRKQIDFKKQCW